MSQVYTGQNCNLSITNKLQSIPRLKYIYNVLLLLLSCSPTPLFSMRMKFFSKENKDANSGVFKLFFPFIFILNCKLYLNILHNNPNMAPVTARFLKINSSLTHQKSSHQARVSHRENMSYNFRGHQGQNFIYTSNSNNLCINLF